MLETFFLAGSWTVNTVTSISKICCQIHPLGVGGRWMSGLAAVCVWDGKEIAFGTKGCFHKTYVCFLFK